MANIAELANKMKETEQLFHSIHFGAVSGEGSSFDGLHLLFSDLYTDLFEKYDDVIELAYSVGETPALGAIPAMPYKKFTAPEALKIAEAEYGKLIDLAVKLFNDFSGNTANDIAVQDLLGGLIAGWHKELNYKIKHRLNK
ncbi:MAG: hypothetical protein FWE37_01125 [Spirochaetaceae bacterium]|nr:hypothetical protein [Spirochaetaceae bacterium]